MLPDEIPNPGFTIANFSTYIVPNVSERYAYPFAFDFLEVDQMDYRFVAKLG